MCLEDVPLGDGKTTHPWGLGNITKALTPSVSTSTSDQNAQSH